METTEMTYIAQSPNMRHLMTLVNRFAVMNEPILIMGETGTGKDLLANFCHQHSFRKGKPFLAINCAALPDEVVESELYGHAAGAYPNALEEKKGFFEQANGGTVLLDEIGEMSTQMQAKLLRFITDGTFRRVGDDEQKSVNVRVICSTQKNLQQLVNEGKFREDLFYRINVLPLFIPPLRERQLDILPLMHHFLQYQANQQGIPTPILTPEAQEQLLSYLWPGNVRQLKNVISVAVANVENGVIDGQSFDFIAQQEKQFSEYFPFLWEETATLEDMLKKFEKHILTFFYQHYPSSRKLAVRLGLSHTAIANKLREYDIRK